MKSKIVKAVIRVDRKTAKIEGIVLIVPNEEMAEKYKSDLNAQNFESFQYEVMDAIFYEGE